MIKSRTNDAVTILDLHGPLIAGEDAAVRKAIRLIRCVVARVRF